MSADSDVFVGHIEEHEPETMTFGSFISLAPSTDSNTVVSGSRESSNSDPMPRQEGRPAHTTRRYYLAQAAISGVQQQNPAGLGGRASAETAGAEACTQACGKTQCEAPSSPHDSGACRSTCMEASLDGLSADLETPAALLALHPDSLQTNLWMSIR